jgi:hypothetical protein
VKTKIIEATNGPSNWGKFLLGRPDVEWSRTSVSSDSSLPILSERGWGPADLLVLDLETGEGAVFCPGGSARADLGSRRILVCPLFEPFLEWLYKQDLVDLDALPDHVDLSDAHVAHRGYRRPGPNR